MFIDHADFSTAREGGRETRREERREKRKKKEGEIMYAHMTEKLHWQ
jgi:hypothetical protein